MTIIQKQVVDNQLVFTAESSKSCKVSKYYVVLLSIMLTRLSYDTNLEITYFVPDTTLAPGVQSIFIFKRSLFIKIP